MAGNRSVSASDEFELTIDVGPYPRANPFGLASENDVFTTDLWIEARAGTKGKKIARRPGCRGVGVGDFSQRAIDVSINATRKL